MESSTQATRRRRRFLQCVAGAIMFLYLLFPVHGFMTHQQHSLTTSPISQTSSYLNADHFSSSSSGDGSSGIYELYNTFDIFLNQCSVQSLMFLMVSLKDRQTAIWLEDFTQPIIHTRTKQKGDNRDEILTKMSTAYNDAMMSRTTQEQKQVMQEKPIKLLTYHGLGAINTTLFPTWDNYFQQLLEEPSVSYEIETTRSHIKQYTLDIVPASLCTRIISVREQLAKEFVHDLDVIAEHSIQVMDHYYQKVKEGTTNSIRINQFFLEVMDQEYRPSPLRKGNFDLLLTLTLQESIHRILNSDNDGSNKNQNIFLRNFYVQRIGTHFTGSNYYGRADEFIEELIQTPPSIIQLQDTNTGLVDPLSIVEQIFKVRETVASEWLEYCLDVPKSHNVIKRLQLNKLMGAYEQNNNDATKTREEKSFE